MDLAAYIYFLKDGKDIGTNVYKIGRTVQRGGDTRVIIRLRQYSPFTILENAFHVRVDKVNEIESTIKQIFRNKYRLVRGTEWFEGNVKDMYEDIHSVIFDYKQRFGDTPADYKDSVSYTDIYSVLLKEMWQQLWQDMSTGKSAEKAAGPAREVKDIVSTPAAITPGQAATDEPAMTAAEIKILDRTCSKCGKQFTRKSGNLDLHVQKCVPTIKKYVTVVIDGCTKQRCVKCGKLFNRSCNRHYDTCKISTIVKIHKPSGLKYCLKLCPDGSYAHACFYCEDTHRDHNTIVRHIKSCPKKTLPAV